MKVSIVNFVYILTICVANESKKLGPFDLVLILDESKSMFELNTTNAPNGGTEHFVQMVHFVIDNFDIGTGETQTRIAIVCSSKSSKLTLKFSDVISIAKWKTCQAPKLKNRKENLDYNLNVTAYFLGGKKVRKDVEKVVIVFTDGVLIGKESVFPNDAEMVRKHGKLFIFHLIEPDELTEGNKTAMITWTQKNENVIYFDVENIDSVKDQFLSAMGKPGSTTGIVLESTFPTTTETNLLPTTTETTILSTTTVTTLSSTTAETTVFSTIAATSVPPTTINTIAHPTTVVPSTVPVATTVSTSPTTTTETTFHSTTTITTLPSTTAVTTVLSTITVTSVPPATVKRTALPTTAAPSTVPVATTTPTRPHSSARETPFYSTSTVPFTTTKTKVVSTTTVTSIPPTTVKSTARPTSVISIGPATTLVPTRLPITTTKHVPQTTTVAGVTSATVFNVPSPAAVIQKNFSTDVSSDTLPTSSPAASPSTVASPKTKLIKSSSKVTLTADIPTTIASKNISQSTEPSVATATAGSPTIATTGMTPTTRRSKPRTRPLVRKTTTSQSLQPSVNLFLLVIINAHICYRIMFN